LKEIDLPSELQRIKEKGWIPSMRKSDTGIGKTIEELLGIRENNNKIADCSYQGMEVEIKGHRVNSNSKVTLFTLEAGERALHDVELMKKYGYIDDKNRLALKVTLTTDGFNQQGLKLETDRSRGTISIIDTNGFRPWTWEFASIHLKLLNLCLIYARSRKRNNIEEFEIESAKLFIGLDANCFFNLLENGFVVIELRMNENETGGSRNRGTAFRVSMKYLENCYQKIERIL
jgi:hypothetical protein